jgi:hypothetical protein
MVRDYSFLDLISFRFEISDLHIEEIQQPLVIPVSEAYIQIYERNDEHI